MSDILNAFRMGVDDGFFTGMESCGTNQWSEECRIAYCKGFDHGVWMYCKTVDQKEEA